MPEEIKAFMCGVTTSDDWECQPASDHPKSSAKIATMCVGVAWT